jgi:hypothetical protein
MQFPSDAPVLPQIHLYTHPLIPTRNLQLSTCNIGWSARQLFFQHVQFVTAISPELARFWPNFTFGKPDAGFLLTAAVAGAVRNRVAYV